jgi:hypothetical protein
MSGTRFSATPASAAARIAGCMPNGLRQLTFCRRCPQEVVNRAAARKEHLALVSSGDRGAGAAAAALRALEKIARA